MPRNLSKLDIARAFQQRLYPNVVASPDFDSFLEAIYRIFQGNAEFVLHEYPETL